VANEDGEGDQRAINEDWRSDGSGIHLCAAGSVSGRGEGVGHDEVERMRWKVFYKCPQYEDGGETI
jgi:hypothetical protein